MMAGLSKMTRALLVVIGGLGFAIYGGYGIVQQHATMQNTEKINVTLESKSVDTVSKRRGVQYKPTASFTYSYNGKQYRSDSIYPSGITQQFSTEETAAKLIEGYSRNDTVQAYINPGKPSEAFLVDKASTSPYFMIVIGSLVSVIGLVSWVRD